LITGLFGKGLGEYFLRTLETFRFAAPPMKRRVGIMEPLYAAPGECGGLYW